MTTTIPLLTKQLISIWVNQSQKSPYLLIKPVLAKANENLGYYDAMYFVCMCMYVHVNGLHN